MSIHVYFTVYIYIYNSYIYTHTLGIPRKLSSQVFVYSTLEMVSLHPEVTSTCRLLLPLS